MSHEWCRRGESEYSELLKTHRLSIFYTPKTLLHQEMRLAGTYLERGGFQFNDLFRNEDRFPRGSLCCKTAAATRR
jgi:hypothetical protein